MQMQSSILFQGHRLVPEEETVGPTLSSPSESKTCSIESTTHDSHQRVSRRHHHPLLKSDCFEEIKPHSDCIITVVHVTCFPQNNQNSTRYNDDNQRSVCCHESLILWNQFCSQTETTTKSEKQEHQLQQQKALQSLLCAQWNEAQFKLYCNDRLATLPTFHHKGMHLLHEPLPSYYLTLYEFSSTPTSLYISHNMSKQDDNFYLHSNISWNPFTFNNRQLGISKQLEKKRVVHETSNTNVLKESSSSISTIGKKNDQNCQVQSQYEYGSDGCKVSMHSSSIDQKSGKSCSLNEITTTPSNLLCASTFSTLSTNGGMHRHFTTMTSISMSDLDSTISMTTMRIDTFLQGQILLVLPIHHGIFLDVDDPFGTSSSSSKHACLSNVDSHLCSPCAIHMSQTTDTMSSLPFNNTTCWVEFLQPKDDDRLLHHHPLMNVESPSFESTQHVAIFQVSFSFPWTTSPCHDLLELSFPLILHARYNEPISLDDDSMISTRPVFIQSPFVQTGSIQLWNPSGHELVHATTTLRDCTPTTTSRGIHVWQIPVGREEHYFIVMPVTLLVSTLGALWMMRELYHVSLRL